MITAETRLDAFRGHLQRMDRATPQARRALVATGAGFVLQRAVQLANQRARDTGRYVRAYQEAYNRTLLLAPEVSGFVGGSMRMTAVTPSKHIRKVFPRLNALLKKFTGLERALLAEVRAEESRIKPNKGRLAWLKKRLDKVGNVTDRVIEQLDAIDRAGEGYRYGIVIGARRTKGLLTVSRVDTVHLRIYGGSARFVGDGVLEVRNMEPHARIVARREGIERQALASLRGTGVQRAGRAYLAALQRASGVKMIGSGGSGNGA